MNLDLNISISTSIFQLAHEAFICAIAAYPFDDCFCDNVSKCPEADIFDVSEYKSIGNMIDKVTYIGAAELFLTKDTSLRPLLLDARALVVGTILERQIRSLDLSRWKPEISEVVECLLKDLSETYGNDHPIRRAKALLAQIEHAYFSGNTSLHFRADELAEEIHELLEREAGLFSEVVYVFCIFVVNEVSFCRAADLTIL